MESYKFHLHYYRIMNINIKKWEKAGLAIGSVLGYITILTGVIITILLLKTIFS